MKEKVDDSNVRRLFHAMKPENMNDIDRKLHALLTDEDFTLVESRRIERSGFNRDVNVNQMEYLRGEKERVFIFTHEPITGAEHGS
jgi:maltooligosyltrehalose synthase